MSVEKERRAGSPRVPFQTLVEIGAGEGSSAAFEAESVDVTTAGLHLRTAYLPEIGESLLCRLDAGGREVVVQGEVVWRNDDNYGGDFGVRFVDVEPDSMQALRELTGDVTLDEAPNATAKPEANTPSVARGTRVRLHIEGLGSPMKARVRDGSRSELMVGSNLEFLKVGRSVDLENVDAADSRPARIERVAIEVEPSTNVPQLVVALRYLDVADAPADEEQELSRVKYDTDGCDKPEDDSTDAARASACGELDDMGDGDEPLDDENGSPEEGEGKGAAVWRKVKETGPKFAVLGLAAKRLGLRAKDAVGDAVARAKKRANEPKEKAQPQRPRRTTAPPPKGGLRSQRARSGHKQVVDEPVPLPADPQPVGGLPKRAATFGVIALLLTVVGVVFAKSGWFAGDSAQAKAAGLDEGAEVAALPAGASGAAAVAPMLGTESGEGLVANVPLFGPTPMTTVAAMAPPAAVPAVAAVAAVAPPPGDTGETEGDTAEDEGGAEVAPMGAIAAAAPSNDDEIADDGDGTTEAAGDDEAESKPAAKPKKSAARNTSDKGTKSFGRGNVRNPTVLTLQMNRAIKSLRGSGDSNGFTVNVIGARSNEPAAGLRRRDSRVAIAKIVNSGSNAKLTVRFRGNAPAYRVQADGHTLRVLIDGGDKKTARSMNQSKPRR